jgi:hypothetical protein
MVVMEALVVVGAPLVLLVRLAWLVLFQRLEVQVVVAV